MHEGTCGEQIQFLLALSFIFDGVFKDVPDLKFAMGLEEAELVGL